jgi:hypothetical protein
MNGKLTTNGLALGAFDAVGALYSLLMRKGVITQSEIGIVLNERFEIQQKIVDEHGMPDNANAAEVLRALMVGLGCVDPGRR